MWIEINSSLQCTTVQESSVQICSVSRNICPGHFLYSICVAFVRYLYSIFYSSAQFKSVSRNLYPGHYLPFVPHASEASSVLDYLTECLFIEITPNEQCLIYVFSFKLLHWMFFHSKCFQWLGILSCLKILRKLLPYYIMYTSSSVLRWNIWFAQLSCPVWAVSRSRQKIVRSWSGDRW